MAAAFTQCVKLRKTGGENAGVEETRENDEEK